MTSSVATLHPFEASLCSYDGARIVTGPGAPPSRARSDLQKIEHEKRVYVGERNDGQDSAQGFFVHMGADQEAPAHFHRIDQFQVFFGGPGVRFQRTEVPAEHLFLHYVDAYSTYGPFSSGPAGLDFMTLRGHEDFFSGVMPGAREALVHRGVRRHEWMLPVGSSHRLRPGGDAVEALLDRQPDGLAVYRVRGDRDSDVACPDPGASGGQFVCILSGQVVVSGRRFGANSVGWNPAGGGPVVLRSGPDGGFDAIVLQYPDPPSVAWPDSQD